jgi:alpha-beta hydrolase superfamily lysophospholipase
VFIWLKIFYSGSWHYCNFLDSRAKKTFVRQRQLNKALGRIAMKRTNSVIRIFGWIVLVLVGLLIIVAAYLFWPVSASALPSHPQPAASYAEALQRVTDIQAQEASGYEEVCKAQLLTHGQKTQRVVILVHGYTHCPAQYRELAPQIFALGYNVLMVPLPRHGLANRMNDDQSQLTALEITHYADQMVDIAQGLGDQVIVLGISQGGAATAWAAQNRSDVYRAVVVSPAFGFKIVPAWLTNAAMRAYQILPNSYTWWDPVKKEIPNPMVISYPRYATRTLAQTLRVAFAVLASSRQTPIKAGSLVVVTNPTDEAVNLEMIDQVTRNWQKLAPQKVSTYQFPASLGLQHDIINPDPRFDLQGLVYPKLIELVQAP